MSITGDRLRDLRKLKRKTLKEVNEDTGIAFGGLAALERGERMCNSATLKILADYYDTTTDYLLGNTDNITASNNDIDAAFYNQHGIISDEQKKDIENFIAFIKSKENL